MTGVGSLSLPDMPDEVTRYILGFLPTGDLVHFREVSRQSNELAMDVLKGIESKTLTLLSNSRAYLGVVPPQIERHGAVARQLFGSPGESLKSLDADGDVEDDIVRDEKSGPVHSVLQFCAKYLPGGIDALEVRESVDLPEQSIRQLAAFPQLSRLRMHYQTYESMDLLATTVLGLQELEIDCGKVPQEERSSGLRLFLCRGGGNTWQEKFGEILGRWSQLHRLTIINLPNEQEIELGTVHGSAVLRHLLEGSPALQCFTCSGVFRRTNTEDVCQLVKAHISLEELTLIVTPNYGAMTPFARWAPLSRFISVPNGIEDFVTSCGPEIAKKVHVQADD